MNSYMTDNGSFNPLKSVNIHDSITMDEYEKHCLVILDKHSELSVLVQVISGSFGHGETGWGIAYDQGRKKEIS